MSFRGTSHTKRPEAKLSSSAAAEAALEGARPLGQNRYKLDLFRALIRRAIFEA